MCGYMSSWAADARCIVSEAELSGQFDGPRAFDAETLRTIDVRLLDVVLCRVKRLKFLPLRLT